MKNYKILKEGRNDKVLVEWERQNSYPYYGKEYSVHTLSLNGELIWGNYFLNLEDAEKFFIEKTR